MTWFKFFPKCKSKTSILLAIKDTFLSRSTEIPTTFRNNDGKIKERSVKSQMRRADRLKSQEVLVLGTQEVESGKAKIKSLDSGETRECALTDL
jgi:histidyl-tRNA synthetase